MGNTHKIEIVNSVSVCKMCFNPFPNKNAFYVLPLHQTTFEIFVAKGEIAFATMIKTIFHN